MRIKNWEKFQHFKDRRPPWVKLYRDLLDDINFFALSDRAGKCLPLIWLVASEKDGGIPEAEELSFRLRLSQEAMKEVLEELVTRKFLVHGQVDPTAMKPATAKDIANRNGFGSRHVSDITKRAVWDRDNGKCRECEATKDIEYDHIHPVSKGGGSEIENIQLLCRPCNRKKRAKTAYQDATPAQHQRSLETERETERETETEGDIKTVPVSKLCTFESWIKTIPADADAIPLDHHVFAYADSVKLPRDFLALEWVYFEKYYTTGNGKAKKYKSWPDHFRTAVESGYGKLWGIGTDGSYYLTTAGKQLQMEVQA